MTESEDVFGVALSQGVALVFSLAMLFTGSRKKLDGS